MTVAKFFWADGRKYGPVAALLVTWLSLLATALFSAINELEDHSRIITV